jgi:hypothetical protein
VIQFTSPGIWLPDLITTPMPTPTLIPTPGGVMIVPTP